ncbi:group II intron maturase-specific domain-containing protein [Roseateles sp. DC23W]|uniref:Group II intron maturase-specific domain-containing protein n=1 Tax=Pelomonas dachongensis TaxID=3299029 RepID=A0ABW7EKF6_9BURK
MERTIEQLRPVLRGWMNYFQHTQGRRALEEMDAWVRRRLRVIAWRQWKRPATRASRLRALGLDAHRAWKSSVNGRGGVVECRSKTHGDSNAAEVPCQHGAGLAGGHPPATPAFYLNRRMRNRTSGGVRGLRGRPLTLLDRHP